jgi:predicted transposase YbfD/YdcC
MDAQATEAFLSFFQILPDPRAANRRHLLVDLVTSAILAVFCGSEDWVDVQEWAVAQEGFLREFLELPHGIPSHDTYGEVFARLDPGAFEACFLSFSQRLAAVSGGRLIAVDGKTLRRSFRHAWSDTAIHMVSAYVSANRLVLGQLAGAGPGQELALIVALLDLLDLRGATVTIDALGCQKVVAQKILARGGDYVLALKSNQPTLYDHARALLDEAILEWRDGKVGLKHETYQEVEGDHGRIETRICWVTPEVRHLPKNLRAEWPGLRALVVVESCREGPGKEPTRERRYYIASHKKPTAKFLAQAVRSHWGIENPLHWQLDVSFREDLCRVRKGHGAENFSRLRRIVLNKLKRELSKKVGIKCKQKICGWSRDYLLQCLLA